MSSRRGNHSRQLIREFFLFSAKERKGIFFLLLIIFMLSALIVYYSGASGDLVGMDFSEFEKEVLAFEASLEPETQHQPAHLREKPVDIMPFDPNHQSAEGWAKTGLSDYVISNIKKYQAHGGQFHTLKDLEKIYGMSKADLEMLKPVLEFPVKMTDTISDAHLMSPGILPVPAPVCINTAGEELLQSVRGIGPVFSSRIIKYRDALGGYYDVSQLMEVFGMTDTLFEKISGSLTIRDTLIKKININEATGKTLIKHPYIDQWKIVNAIENYREQHGRYDSVGDLRKLHLITDEWLLRVQPYFTTE